MIRLMMNKRTQVKLHEDSELYKCIVDCPTGREYYLAHIWKCQRYLAFIAYYRCIHCNKKITKKEFQKRNDFYNVLF